MSHLKESRDNNFRFSRRTVGAKATFSVHGNPSGWTPKSVSTDFHALRQDFSPTSAGNSGSKSGSCFYPSP